MARRSRRYWTHGVDTAVEFPERCSLIRHAGWGTLIREPETTASPGDNDVGSWFHIAVPTLTRLRKDNEIVLGDFTIGVSLNENAELNLVHVRHGWELLHSYEVRRSNGTFWERIDVPGLDEREVNMGLAVCMRVRFLSGTPEGEAVFYGAAANFVGW